MTGKIPLVSRCPLCARLRSYLGVFCWSFLGLSYLLTVSGNLRGQARPTASRPLQDGDSKHASDSPIHSYVVEPVAELLKSVPELAGLQPATDEQILPVLLDKTGEKVDGLFATWVCLSAKEEVLETRPVSRTGPHDMFGPPSPVLKDTYEYFIAREGTLTRKIISEYRMDREKNESAAGVGFLSSGFASSVMYFSKEFQSESTYRYLGEERVGTRDTYVVAFAQNQAKARIRVALGKDNGSVMYVLLHGIVWIDKANFEVLQLRTDLLAPGILLGSDEEKDKLETLVHFREVRPTGVERSLWLPSDAHVSVEMEYFVYDTQQNKWFPAVKAYNNAHQFADYQRYDGPEVYGEGREHREQKNEESHPYLEGPLQELVKRIPGLKEIRPAVDQQQLPRILHNTGAAVDELLASMVDVIANEAITQEWLIPGDLAPTTEHVRDSYLILRRNEGGGARFRESRMDAQGNRTAEEGSKKGFFVTSGFALSVVHFATTNQWDSRFLYLGDEKVEGRDTYVVAYAQLPTQAHNTVTIKGKNGITVDVLTQGIAWIDQSNFQIVQMRTDLLARQPEIGLEELTTEIWFKDVRFADVAVPLWLPRTVDVHIKFRDLRTVSGLGYVVFGTPWTLTTALHRGDIFRNLHHYTDYRRYRVNTKMITP
jgi:hypothetical protein